MLIIEKSCNQVDKESYSGNNAILFIKTAAITSNSSKVEIEAEKCSLKTSRWHAFLYTYFFLIVFCLGSDI